MSKKRKDDIANCPFCNSTPDVYKMSSTDLFNEFDCVGVMCSNCPARVEVNLNFFNPLGYEVAYEEARMDAIRLWNTRPENK